jgi:hypothetical protein
MTALPAAYKCISTALDGAGSWGSRVYADRVPAVDSHSGVERPYVVIQWSGGGEELAQQDVEHARLVMTVKCVADDMAASLVGAGQISAALREQGAQEGNTLGVFDGWTVTTITQDRVVHLVEAWAGSQPIYHDGHQFILQMERTG